MKKTTQKGSYTFLNTVIWASILIIRVSSRSFNILNTMMENESKIFTNISIFYYNLCRRSWYLFSFSTLVINKIKSLAPLNQVTVGQNYDWRVVYCKIVAKQVKLHMILQLLQYNEKISLTTKTTCSQI